MDVLTCHKGFFNIKKNGQLPLFVMEAKFAHRPLQSCVGDTTKTEDSSAASHTSYEEVGTENIPHSTPNKKDVSHRTTQSALDVEVSSDFLQHEREGKHQLLKPWSSPPQFAVCFHLNSRTFLLNIPLRVR